MNTQCISKAFRWQMPLSFHMRGREKLNLFLCAIGIWIGLASASEAHDDLQLLGAVVSSQKSVALVKNIKTSQVKAYKLGDNVWGYGKLVAVDRQAIILDAGGAEPITVSSKLGGPRKGKFAPKVLVSNADKHIEEGFERLGTKTSVDASYRDRMIKQELPNILMQASSEPVIVNGEIIGFRLFQFEENSIFGKLGMRDGDVVKEINGVALNNVAKTIQFLNGLKTESNVAVTITRDGQPVSLELNVR